MDNIITRLKKFLFNQGKKRYNENESAAADEQGCKIIIINRNDEISAVNQISNTLGIPRITIFSVNQRIPDAFGVNDYREEVDVPHENLGRGITVKKQRKPGICPNCRTPGKISENTGGDERWKCVECEYIFN